MKEAMVKKIHLISEVIDKPKLQLMYKICIELNRLFTKLIHN